MPVTRPRRTRLRRTRLHRLPASWAVLGSVLLVVAALGVRVPAATAAAPVIDAFSTSSTFRTTDGWYASPVHASMMPDGRIMFVGVARDTDPPTPQTPVRRVAWMFTPPPPGAPVPATTTITELAEPVEKNIVLEDGYYINDDFECMGSVHDAQGHLITAGGTRAEFNPVNAGGYEVYGLPYLSTYTGSSWTRGKTMVAKGPKGTTGRWYPTLTRLPSGKVLITGGVEYIDLLHLPKVTATSNYSIESYDPETGQQQVVADRKHTPRALHASDYVHAFVLPYTDANGKDLVMLAENGVPVLGSSTEVNSYAATNATRPGTPDPSNSYGASSVQLPIRAKDQSWGYSNGAAMVVNGNMDSPYEHRADVYDPRTNAWSHSTDTLTARHHPSTVILPDGRILVVNGHDMMGGLGVEKAQYIDPRRNFAVTTGTASEGLVRGYHNVAMALPDGRVLVAGGRDQLKDSSLEKPSYQIYTPAYPTGAKPQLVNAPATMSYRDVVQLHSTGPAPKEMVLISLGSVTHGIDMDQRSVQLPIVSTVTRARGTTVSTVRTPENSHVATPGYYWLYGLSTAGIPSPGKLVKIS